MAKKKSVLDKFLDGQVRKAKKKVRKTVTGSSDSLKTQVKKKTRKAVTGSSETLGTQFWKKVRRTITGSGNKP